MSLRPKAAFTMGRYEANELAAWLMLRHGIEAVIQPSEKVVIMTDQMTQEGLAEAQLEMHNHKVRSRPAPSYQASGGGYSE